MSTRRSANGSVGSTPPRKRPPWNFHQPRTLAAAGSGSGGLSSAPGTPRVAINKENVPQDDSLASVSSSSNGLSNLALPKPAASPAGPVKSATLPSSTSAGMVRRIQQQQSLHQRQRSLLSSSSVQSPPASQSQEFEVMTCSGLLKEVLASAAASSKQKQQKQKQPQQQQPASPDHLVAIRQLAGQLASKVAHRPDCVSLLSELDARLDQLAADIDLVASQLRDENRVLRRRVRQLEAKLTVSGGSQSECGQANAATPAAGSASQSESARREWSLREAQLLARLQAAESARSALEARSAALEKELKEMARISRPVSVVSNGASNAPTTPTASATPSASTAAASAQLTAENLARHASQQRAIEIKAAAAATRSTNFLNNYEDDDYAITSVSQQRQQRPARQQRKTPLPPPAATSSPPTLDTAPPVAANHRHLVVDDDQDDLDEDDDESNGDADEAEFRRGLARIEEQIARLQMSLGGGGANHYVNNRLTSS